MDQQQTLEVTEHPSPKELVEAYLDQVPVGIEIDAGRIMTTVVYWLSGL